MMKMLILLTFLAIHSSGHRIQLSDSILDIINTEHVEKILAERRMNASLRNEHSKVLNDGKRYLVQNDLDEEVTENNANNNQTPEVSIDFDFNPKRLPSTSIRGDVVMSYNDSIQYSPNSPPSNSDILADLQSYRGDKLLKSSKNALYVTRKEYLKKDWCKTEPLIQRIREEGCLSRTIVNRFCYGQCNSFYIPKSPKRRRHPNKQHYRPDSENFEDEDLTGPAFRSCAFCKPKKFTWITVTLRCPSLVPQIRRKRIQRIKQCKCIAEPLN